MKIVVLYSGGLDSLIMLHMARTWHPDAEIKCLYYKHGADSESSEIARLPNEVEVRHIDWLNDQCRAVSKKDDPFAGAIYIPGRNLVFTTLAACQELPDEIWMGTLWDEDNEQATDKNTEFMEDTSELLSYVLSPFIDKVKIRFPFVEQKMTKELSVSWALRHGISEDDLVSTVSCWHHTDMACGVCKQCFKRYFIFVLNGFQERCKVHPLYSRHGKELLKQYLSCTPKNRDEQTVVDMIKRATPLLDVPIQNQIRDILLETTRKDRSKARGRGSRLSNC